MVAKGQVPPSASARPRPRLHVEFRGGEFGGGEGGGGTGGCEGGGKGEGGGGGLGEGGGGGGGEGFVFFFLFDLVLPRVFFDSLSSALADLVSAETSPAAPVGKPPADQPVPTAMAPTAPKVMNPFPFS